MDSDLYHAVITNDIDVLKQMDDKLAVEDQVTPTNNTVLHLACQYGSIDCVKEILFVHELLLLKTNSRDETALHLAARHGYYDVVLELIAAAKSSSLQTNDLPNASSTIVQTMIRSKNVELETALHTAVRYNHYTVVQLLVKEDPSHEHSPNKRNETPAYLATARGYTHILRTILHYCESPTFDGPNGRTALHAAVLDKEGESMRLLLDKKKDLMKVADDYGWTVYHYAAYNDLDKVVTELVSADKFVGNLSEKEHKRTPLHIAAYEGKLDVMKELIKYYPDSLEVVDGNGQNILHIAAEKEVDAADQIDLGDVIRYILSLGFKACNNLLIQKDNKGDTALHLIAKLGHCYDELMNLRTELDWQVLNDKNHTPLDVLQTADTRLAEQVVVRRALDRTDIRKRWRLWRLRRKMDIEQQRDTKRGKEENLKEMKTLINTHMIVAALITTVALTAGFAMPGGFDEKNGSAVLKTTAFKTFIVSDALALLFSMSSLFLYFFLTFSENDLKVLLVLSLCALFNAVSVVAMMLAFMAGTYAVLPHLSKIAITVCVISSLFILLVVYFFGIAFSFLIKAAHLEFIP